MTDIVKSKILEQCINFGYTLGSPGSFKILMPRPFPDQLSQYVQGFLNPQCFQVTPDDFHLQSCLGTTDPRSFKFSFCQRTGNLQVTPFNNERELYSVYCSNIFQDKDFAKHKNLAPLLNNAREPSLVQANAA